MPVPQVSVIIPLYNKEQYIARTIASVLAQTYADYALLVIDDGSTDNSAHIVRQFSDARLRLIQQANRGEGPTRERGIAEAHSEFVAFLDADDEWRPLFLERAVALLRDFPDAVIGGMGYALMQPDGQAVPMAISNLPSASWRGIATDFFALALKDPPLHPSAVIMRKSLFADFKPKTSPSKIGADQYLWCQIALRYPIALDTDIQMIYHMEAEQRAMNCQKTLGELPFVTLLKHHLRRGEINHANADSMRQYISVYQLHSIWKALRVDGDKAVAWSIFRKWRPIAAHKREYYRYLVELLIPTGMVRRIHWVMTHKKLAASLCGLLMLACIVLRQLLAR